MKRLLSDRWQLTGEIVLPLLVFCAVEIGLRSYIAATPTAPMPNLLPFPISTGKYLAYRELASDEDLDVLLMGMSQMMRVSAKRLQGFLAGHSHPQVSVFNFSAPLQWVEFNRRLLKDIVLQVRRPRLVVLGIIPTNLVYERTEEGTEEMIQSLPVFRLHAGTPASWLEETILNSFDLMKYREVIQGHLAGRPVLQTPFWVKAARATDEVGDISIVLHVPVRPVRGLNKWEKNLIPQLRDFASQLDENPLFEHVAAFAEFCRRNDIRLVVLNSPVHPIYLKILPRGLDDYDEFGRRLRAVAEENGALFFDPAGGKPADPGLFRDAVHTNEAGTEWITDQIGRFLVEHDAVRSLPPKRSMSEVWP